MATVKAIFSTLLYVPRTTNSQTTPAASGTEMYFEMPKSLKATRNPYKLRHDVAEVRDDERDHQQKGRPQAELFTNDIG